MFGGFGAGAMGGMPQRFEECYHCYSVAYADKSHLEVSPVIVAQAGSIDANPRLLEGWIAVNDLPARGVKGWFLFATALGFAVFLLLYRSSSLDSPLTPSARPTNRQQ